MNFLMPWRHYFLQEHTYNFSAKRASSKITASPVYFVLYLPCHTEVGQAFQTIKYPAQAHSLLSAILAFQSPVLSFVTVCAKNKKKSLCFRSFNFN